MLDKINKEVFYKIAKCLNLEVYENKSKTKQFTTKSNWNCNYRKKQLIHEPKQNINYWTKYIQRR